MKFVVAGGSGFIGQPLVRSLMSRGDVLVLSRDPDRVGDGRGVRWDPATRHGEWVDHVAEADVVVNLAGASIAGGRWTVKRKRELVESRLRATTALVDAMRTRSKARTFLSASAIGYYGSRGEELLDEGAPPGDDFLAGLAERWEAAACGAREITRVVIPRIGIVLAADGGALPSMLLPFRFFAGGPVGSGRQWMSWIERGDLLRMLEWLIDSAEAKGVYNATAPAPIRNAEFAKTLGSVMKRPSVLRTPGTPLKWALGEMADSLLLASARVIPTRAAAEGFAFRFPELVAALRSVLDRHPGGRR
jgi:uncharacterized protein (TIGR01777 family)